jgi:hypothetical protein
MQLGNLRVCTSDFRVDMQLGDEFVHACVVHRRWGLQMRVVVSIVGSVSSAAVLLCWYRIIVCCEFEYGYARP